MASKTSTIVLTDVVGSTELRVAIGEERADELRRKHDAMLGEAVVEAGGSVIKGLGDGLLLMFDGAADALTAAVAIQRAAAHHTRRNPQEPLRLRVGVAAGDVSVEDGDCFGQPVVVAARLCAEAAAGQILASDLVRMLSGGRGDHSFGERAAFELKGIPDPVDAVTVEWDDVAAGQQSQLPAALESRASLPFAGRRSAVDQLVEAWKASVAGDRNVVFISGEPGIGKTRLAAEIARYAHGEGALVAFGRCDDDLDAPYRPFAAAIHSLIAVLEDADLRAHRSLHGGALVRLAPELADSLGAAPLSLDGEAERLRLFDAVADFFERCATRSPVVIVLDDLHWADHSTLKLLRHLVRNGAQAPLLVIATYRDTDLDRTHPLADVLGDLHRERGVQRLALTGLDRGELTELLEAAAGHDLPQVGRLVEFMHAETEGNVFFIGEVLAHLIEGGALRRDGDRWSADEEKVERLGVPQGVREVVGRRLSALSEECNTLLAVAAVIGADVDVRVLAAVAERDVASVLETLEVPVRRRLLAESHAGALRMTFSHALVRQTLYDELSTARRLTLHAKVGRHLATQPTVEVAEVARHLVEAVPVVDGDEAIAWCEKAATDAAMRLGWEQATAWYRRALEVDEVLGSDAGRRALLLIRLGRIRNLAGEADGARTDFMLAADLARRAERPDLLAKAATAYGGLTGVMAFPKDTDALALINEALEAVGQDDAKLRVRLLQRKVSWLILTDEQERRPIALQALEEARASGDQRLIARAYATLMDAADSASAEEARDAALTAFTMSVEVGDLSTAGSAAHRLSRQRLAYGDRAGARRWNDEFVKLADDTGSRFGAWGRAAFAAGESAIAGDFDSALRHSDEAASFASYVHRATVLVNTSWARLYVHWMQGRLDEMSWSLPLGEFKGLELFPVVAAGMRGDKRVAYDGLRAFLDAEDGLPSFNRGAWAVLIAHAAALADDETLVREALEFMEHPVPPIISADGCFIWPTDYFRGLLAARLGDAAAAREHFSSALSVLSGLEERPWSAHTEAALARIAAADGDTDGALAHAESALRTATELSMAPLAAEMRSFLAETPAVASTS